MSDEKTQADPLLEFWHGQGTAVIHLSKLKPLLAQHGFHIVTEAEKRVLDACAAMTIGMPSAAPRPPAKIGPIPKAGVMAVVEAELARRTP